MADIGEEWTSSSTESLSLALVDEKGQEAGFKALFTYPIFGEKELIWGYKDLQLGLKFDATTLLPLVSSDYSKVKPDDKDVVDPVKTLQEFLPGSACTRQQDWQHKRQEEWPQFELPGENAVPDGNSVADANGVKYAIRKVKMSSKGERELHERLRIFILLFIEAGSFIDMDDDRWEFYLLYQLSDTGQPKFAGFSSAYPYFWYKDSPTHDKMSHEWPIRMRISQFVILPPFQGLRLGAQLYSSLFNRFLETSRVREVTVEDPSEQFDDLRDRCDLERLAKAGVWSHQKFKIGRSIDPAWLEKTRERQKMAPRQFSRCVEMAKLHQIDADGKEPDKEYKLFVKRRLYQKNYEALSDMSKPEQLDKLEEVFNTLIEDYRRILGPVDFSEDRKGKKRAAEEME